MMRKPRAFLGFGPMVILVGSALALVAPARAVTRLIPEQYPTIQAGIDACADGDTVLLSPGVYTGPGNRAIELRGLDVTVTSREGSGQTVIDCEQAARGFYLHEGESRAARIERLTIRNGRTVYGDPGAAQGAGIYCSVSNPTIADCVITGNESATNGGGIYLLSNGIVERCFIVGNRAGWDGGGVATQYGTATVEDCVITNNTAQQGGGVAFIGTAVNALRGCTVSANEAHFGGGVCTYNRGYLEECIVWGNCALPGEEQVSARDGGVDFQCCDIDTSGVSSMGEVNYSQCVFTDPLFCGPVPCGLEPTGDWSLDVDSPCVPENSPCGQQIGALGVGCGAGFPMGACCFPNGSCVIETQSECSADEGAYQGDDSLCEPNPCVPTATEVTTWGRVKARFRSDGR